jgi:hypothetical protein
MQTPHPSRSRVTIVATAAILACVGCAPAPILVRTSAIQPDAFLRPDTSCPIPAIRFRADGAISPVQGTDGHLDRCLISFPQPDRRGVVVELSGVADPCRTGTLRRAWMVARSDSDSLILGTPTPSSRAEIRKEPDVPIDPELRCRVLDSILARIEVVVSDSVVARTCFADDPTGFRRCPP